MSIILCGPLIKVVIFIYSSYIQAHTWTLDLGEPTHTLIPCWMPKPLPQGTSVQVFSPELGLWVELYSRPTHRNHCLSQHYPHETMFIQSLFIENAIPRNTIHNIHSIHNNTTCYSSWQ